MQLAYVCLWNDQFGRDELSSPHIDKYYFVLDEFSNEWDEIQSMLDFYNYHCKNKVSLELVETEILPGDELVGYIKTHYIKIIQRKWRKIIQERKRVRDMRKNPREIMYREKHGKWSNNVNIMPGLRGMLSSNI